MKRTLKKLLRSFLSRCRGKGIDKIPDALINKAQVISFDVFDTLVLRSVGSPVDVFDIVESSYNQKGIGKTVTAFKAERIKAETRARSKSAGKEITLGDIYLELSEVYDSATAEALRNIETESELSVCKANPEMLAFYQKMMSLGKRIIIVSDMYLPSEVIGTVLTNCGFDGYEKLYVSSEYGVMKRYGELFEVVKQDYKDVNLLHIGDHPIADYSVVKRMGMNAFLYRNTVAGKNRA